MKIEYTVHGLKKKQVMIKLINSSFHLEPKNE